MTVVAIDSALGGYGRQVRSFPMLEVDEELELARRWRKENDVAARNRLVESHLRLVGRVARQHGGYGVSLADLVAEGRTGLLEAAKAFDPERGVRFATLALLCIRKAIWDFIIRTRSVVRMGTTAGQKKLFYRLEREKAKLGRLDGGSLTPAEIEQVSQNLGVRSAEVELMETRLGAMDCSLSAPAPGQSEGCWEDRLADERENQEDQLLARDEKEKQRALVQEAMKELSPRERAIIEARHFTEEPATFDELSKRFGISRQRVSQIEQKGLMRVKETVRGDPEAMN